jgi:hypothetical protein
VLQSVSPQRVSDVSGNRIIVLFFWA